MFICLVYGATCDVVINGTPSPQALPTSNVANGRTAKWLGLHFRASTDYQNKIRAPVMMLCSREERAAAQHARLQQATWRPEKHLYIRPTCKLGQARVQLGRYHHRPGQMGISLHQSNASVSCNNRVHQQAYKQQASMGFEHVVCHFSSV